MLPTHFVTNHPSPSDTLYVCINFPAFLAFHAQGLVVPLRGSWFLNPLLHWSRAHLAQGPPSTTLSMLALGLCTGPKPDRDRFGPEPESCFLADRRPDRYYSCPDLSGPVYSGPVRFWTCLDLFRIFQHLQFKKPKFA